MWYRVTVRTYEDHFEYERRPDKSSNKTTEVPIIEEVRPRQEPDDWSVEKAVLMFKFLVPYRYQTYESLFPPYIAWLERRAIPEDEWERVAVIEPDRIPDCYYDDYKH